MLEKILDYIAVVVASLFICAITIFLVFLFIKIPPVFYFAVSLTLFMWSFERTGRFMDKRKYRK